MSDKRPRLTPTQQIVLILMEKGREIIFDTHPLSTGAALTGERRRMYSNTFFALRDKGLIEKVRSKWPFEYYRISEAGKRALASKTPKG